jgi:hypothetical protein
MRCVAPALLLAAVLLVAGCNLFYSSDVRVAEITSVLAPDTVHVDSAFHASITAWLGPTSRYVLERFQVSNSATMLTVQAWSRLKPDVTVIEEPSYQGFGVEARATQPGKFRIIAIQPDRRDTLKTITVLP